MSRKQNQFFTEAIVGVFMVAVILLLAYFTIVISGVDILKGNEKSKMTIVFSEVGGLKDHDSVMYRGTKVGTVEHVEVTSSNLVVHALVDRRIVLRTGYRITVRNLSMLGGNYMHIEEGKGEIMPLEETVFSGDIPIDWMRDVAEATRNFKEFSQKLNNSDFVGKADSTIEDIRTAIAEAKGAMSAFKTAAESFNAKESLEKVNKLMDDMSAVMKDVRQVIDNYRDTTPISTFSSLATGAL